jgi:hypothetical protein
MDAVDLDPAQEGELSRKLATRRCRRDRVGGHANPGINEAPEKGQVGLIVAASKA